MTENTTNTAISETDQSKESADQIADTTQTKNKNTLSLVAIAVGVVAIGLSGWTLYQQQLTIQSIQPLSQKLSQVSDSQNNLSQKVTKQSSVSQSLPALQKKQSEHDARIKQLKEDFDGSQIQVTQQNNKLLSLGQQLNRIGNTTKEDWKLAETEYLIRLANQRLLMENDIVGAENLLTSADQILSEMADPILFDTRKAIAKDIQSLKATSSFDTEGLYLQLDALATQIEKLPQREPSKQWKQNNETEDNVLDNSERTIQSTLSELFASVKSLVVINYDHKPIKALLPAADYQELVSSIQVQISVAQLALLKKQNTIYQTSLQHVVEAVSTHFEIKAKPVVAFMTSITALQQINPEPELPLPRGSLTAIKKLMTEWQSLSLSNSQKDNPIAETEIQEKTDYVQPAKANTKITPEPASQKAEKAPQEKHAIKTEDSIQAVDSIKPNVDAVDASPQPETSTSSKPETSTSSKPETSTSSKPETNTESEQKPESDTQSNTNLNEVSA
ncbi:uroporphyrinogen-III C-methyltransferase [Marinomonas sp. 2405UD68-3]|uniref:uroporphyrinogen-III C-methyltransferase n=1 Tax=Marinomonas sp. 2405UD68-3 TaxID=3391835 RepID=UPI0039C8E851